mgnify:CR=1 FL=1
MFQVINDEITSDFFEFISKDLGEDKSVKTNFDSLWEAAYEYCSKFPREFIFTRRMTYSCIVQQDESESLKPFYEKLDDFLAKAIADGAMKEMSLMNFVYIALSPLYGIMKSTIENGKFYMQSDDLELYKSTSWNAIKG